jgi:hypothetical protein
MRREVLGLSVGMGRKRSLEAYDTARDFVEISGLGYQVLA